MRLRLNPPGRQTSTAPSTGRTVCECARRERPHPGAQLRLTDHNGWRITCFATNTRQTGWTLATPEVRHRQRAEDGIRCLKVTGLRNLPFHSYHANRIWLEIVALASDLIAWTQTLAFDEHQPARRWEPKRFRFRLLAVAGRIIRTLTKVSGVVPEAWGMSRFQLLSDAQWELIAGLLPVRTGKRGRPFRDARPVVEDIIDRYRCGIAWRDVPEVFGPWQTIWTWHRRMSEDGTWDAVLARLLSVAEEAGIIDWAVAVDSTIARHVTKHQPPHKGAGSNYTNLRPTGAISGRFKVDVSLRVFDRAEDRNRPHGLQVGRPFGGAGAGSL